jgi:hypothetical protein
MVPAAREGSGRIVAVRDSKNPDAAHLICTPAQWRAFTAGVRHGDFNLG